MNGWMKGRDEGHTAISATLSKANTRVLCRFKSKLKNSGELLGGGGLCHIPTKLGTDWMGGKGRCDWILHFFWGKPVPTVLTSFYKANFLTYTSTPRTLISCSNLFCIHIKCIYQYCSRFFPKVKCKLHFIHNANPPNSYKSNGKAPVRRAH
jgi:hypothetical protein